MGVTISGHAAEPSLASEHDGREGYLPYASPNDSIFAALFLAAFIANSTSSKVLKYPRTNRTVPSGKAPRARCARGEHSVTRPSLKIVPVGGVL